MSKDFTDDAVKVLERIAREQSSDPETDDLTVPLAIELAEASISLARITAERDAARAALKKIVATEDGGHDSDWAEIILMRQIARAAMTSTECVPSDDRKNTSIFQSNSNSEAKDRI